MEKPQKYLFVCAANVNRSKTGEEVFKRMLEEKGFSVGTLGTLDQMLESDFYVGSAGTDIDFMNLRQGVQYTPEFGNLADKIFVADARVYVDLKEYFRVSEDKMINLGIRDRYDIKLPNERRNLQRIMRKKLAPYVPEKK
jgi:protein-tyrosine-phosphatase